ncbi:MAG TPA: FadR/GntR family transcriptional regulator [Gaiellales bacterium]|jgi:GntR family transcriptional repressor for pyruvate dehydrogenase complex
MLLGRQTLSQAVSAAVLERIRSGEFGPGDRLPTEKSLMAEYGVGRNSVREAVQALVTLGLVDVRPGRGATVIAIESDAVMDAETISVLLKEEAVDDLYAFRRLLEIEIASRAAAVATPADLEGIAASIRAFESALEQGRPISTLDDEFHAAVARASHNAIYATVLDAVSGLIANARRLSMNVPWASQTAKVEHARLYEAIAAHDSEAAAEIMRTHLDSAIAAIEEGRAKAAEGA